MTCRHAGWAPGFAEPLRVKPGCTVRLPEGFDPANRLGLYKKKDGARLLRRGTGLLEEYQRRLAAQDTYGVLVVLQAIDVGGKDGTIRHVMSGVNPQGVSVSSFKAPSAEDLGHDYLWRPARRLPARGEIGIFNRSHYDEVLEEVLVARVHPENLDRQKLPPEAKGAGVWKRRYREINDWERYLTHNGIRLVKLFLNVSKEEQRTRFLKRIDTPEKNWTPRYPVMDNADLAGARPRAGAQVREWLIDRLADGELLGRLGSRWVRWASTFGPPQPADLHGMPRQGPRRPYRLGQDTELPAAYLVLGAGGFRRGPGNRGRAVRGGRHRSLRPAGRTVASGPPARRTALDQGVGQSE
ncbi:MAG: polyphosphate kinase 2 family protein [Actinomycetota bacterium]|nr:polyphosphate kinase 2 family protein [Actinomycetota bacterium]